jgi:hypothetical protein
MAGWMVRDRRRTRREAMVQARENRHGSHTSTSNTRCNVVFRPFAWLWNDAASDENHCGSCGKLVVDLALLSGAAGIVYYAATAEAITTVAHVCPHGRCLVCALRVVDQQQQRSMYRFRVKENDTGAGCSAQRPHQTRLLQLCGGR